MPLGVPIPSRADRFLRIFDSIIGCSPLATVPTILILKPGSIKFHDRQPSDYQSRFTCNLNLPCIRQYRQVYLCPGSGPRTCTSPKQRYSCTVPYAVFYEWGAHALNFSKSWLSSVSAVDELRSLRAFASLVCLRQSSTVVNSIDSL